MPIKSFGIVAMLLFISCINTQAQALKTGMPAPEFKVSGWVKGKPISKLDTGKIYIVEFWATWCNPCKAAIPQLSELQKRYKGQVIIIGVAAMEKDLGYVPVFVESMGDKMDYHIVKDDLGQPGAAGGYMVKNWLSAAGAPGIPWAFIVDKSGKIAYAGGSAGLEAALEEVLKGKSR